MLNDQYYDPKYDEGFDFLSDTPPRKSVSPRDAADSDIAEDWRDQYESVSTGQLAYINARYGTNATAGDLRVCASCSNLAPRGVMTSYTQSLLLCPECSNVRTIAKTALKAMNTTPITSWRCAWADAVCYYKSLHTRGLGSVLPNGDEMDALFDEYRDYFDAKSTRYIPPERLQFNEDLAISGYGKVSSSRGYAVYRRLIDNLKALTNPGLTEALRGICDVLDDGGNTL